MSRENDKDADGCGCFLFILGVGLAIAAAISLTALVDPFDWYSSFDEVWAECDGDYAPAG